MRRDVGGSERANTLYDSQEFATWNDREKKTVEQDLLADV